MIKIHIPVSKSQIVFTADQKNKMISSIYDRQEKSTGQRVTDLLEVLEACRLETCENFDFFFLLRIY